MEDKALETTVREIVARCVKKVCHDLTSKNVWDVTNPLTNAVVDMVAWQHELDAAPELQTNHYVSFELFCRILDEIAKEVPCVSRIKVNCTNITREQRRQYIDRYGDTNRPGASSAETL